MQYLIGHHQDSTKTDCHTSTFLQIITTKPSEIFLSRSPVFRGNQCNHHVHHGRQGHHGQQGPQGQHSHHDHRPQSKAQQELSLREPRIQDGCTSRG